MEEKTSYEKINYALRPAKNIERKMFCEAFQRLTPFDKVENYKYIGFGSTFFSDFALFHKKLNISQMISIEKDVLKRKRFKFNRPFNCIKLRFGNSWDLLPRIQLSNKAILWLDYDEKLRTEMLKDLKTYANKANSGNLILVTVDVKPDSQNPSEREESKDVLDFRFEALQKRLDKKSIGGRDKNAMKGDGLTTVSQQIIKNKILTTLKKEMAAMKRIKKFIINSYLTLHMPMEQKC